MRKLVCYTLFFAGLALSLLTPGFSQVLPFHYYTLSDGLPSNGVNDLCQDSRGFLWIATTEGVSVYDGTTFTNYRTSDGLARGLVTRIIESRTAPGTVWIATFGGEVSKFQDGTFTTFQMDSSIGDVYINALAEDYTGTLWCTASGTVYRLQNDGFSKFRIGDEPFMAQTLTATPDSLVWIAAWFRLYLFSPKAARVTTTIDLPLRRPQSVVSHMFADRNGDVWIGTTDSLLLQFHGRVQVAQRQITCGVPLHIMEDKQGTLWIGTTNGLLSIPKSRFAKAPFLRYTTEDGLLDNTIWTGLVDHENNLYFSQRNKGLGKLSNRNLYRFPLKGLGDLYNNSKAVADGNGHLWIPSGQKLAEIWSDEDGRWHQYLHPIDVGEDIKQITYIVYDARGHLWVNTLRSLIGFAIVARTGTYSNLVRVKHLRPSLAFSAFPLQVFAFDRQGYVWITLADGRVAKFDPDNPKPLRIYAFADKLPELILVLYQDREQNLWLGGFGGGLLMLPAKGAAEGAFRRFTTADGLPENQIRAVIQDHEGKIWVGTRTGGLAVYVNGIFKTISVRDGLLSNTIWAMAEDDSGRI